MVVPLSEKHIKEIAEIYARELPSSPLVFLGKDFLERFYYRYLIQRPDTAAFVYLIDNQVAGFVIGVNQANTFFNRLIKDHIGALIKILFFSIYKRPLLLFHVLGSCRFILAKPAGYQTEAKDAEIVTLAVRPEFRSPEFFKERGIKIAKALVETALAQLKRSGAKRVKAFIEQSNVMAQIFYRNLGFRYVRPIRIGRLRSGLYLLEMMSS